MKRKGKEFLIWFLTALFGVLIVICSAFLMTALAVTLPEEKNRGSVETQNILSEENCPEAMDGRLRFTTMEKQYINTLDRSRRNV